MNLSDREVNLKVLFSPLVRDGKLSMDERNVVMRRAAPEVVSKVTDDNELQSLRISLDELRSAENIDVFARCQARLVEADILNAVHERLPTAEEVTRRRKTGWGILDPSYPSWELT